MTDEKYVFIQDVKEKQSVNRGKGRVGKCVKGCTLPSDTLSPKEKRDKNSEFVTMNFNQPMRIEKFVLFKEDSQKEYLQNLIDNHGGTTARIANMMGCTEAKIKLFRQDLNISSVNKQFLQDNGAEKWAEFLKNGDYLRKPMSYDEFKKLDNFDKADYLNYLLDTINVTWRMIGNMMGVDGGTLRIYVHRANIPVVKSSCGRRPSNADLKLWEEFLSKKDDPKEGMEMDKQTKAPNNKVSSDMIEQNLEEIKKDIKKDINETIRQDYQYIYGYTPYSINGISTELTEKAKEQGFLSDYDVRKAFGLEGGSPAVGIDYSWSKEAERIEVPHIYLSVTVHDQEEAVEILETLPKAKRGKIIFTFGEEDTDATE